MPALAPALALGVVAGLLSGLFGVGGGVVLVPGLVLWLGLDQHHAHATSLAAILVTATGALIPFMLDRSVAYGPGLALATGAIIGSYAGAGMMARISATRLRQAFAVFVLLAAARLLLANAFDTTAHLEAGLGRLAAFAGVGLAAGLLSAVMGVGGGVILVPAMVLLFEFGQHAAEGTSLLVIVPTAIVGALRHGRTGFTDWRLGGVVGAGGLVGGIAGGAVAVAMPGAVLQRVFAVFLAAVAVRLLVAGSRRRPDPIDP
jgi:uncharacterized membrane protein YfcA